MAINSFRPFLRRSSPNKSTTSKWPKWRLFEVFFAFSGSAEAVRPPKSGYPSTDIPQLDLECRFVVATATRVKIQSQKGFSTVYHRQSVYKEDKNSGE